MKLQAFPSNGGIVTGAAVHTVTATKGHGARQKRWKTKQTVANSNPQTNTHGQHDCKYCGSRNARNKCPAYGSTCDKCGGKNNFAKI